MKIEGKGSLRRSELDSSFYVGVLSVATYLSSFTSIMGATPFSSGFLAAKCRNNFGIPQRPPNEMGDDISCGHCESNVTCRPSATPVFHCTLPGSRCYS